MSETPQSTVEQFCRELERESDTQGTQDPESVAIAEAIRAVLAQLEQARIDRDEAISQCVSIGRESKKLEAERDALRSRVEAVLALAKVRHASEAYDAGLRDVLRILDGCKP